MKLQNAKCSRDKKIFMVTTRTIKRVDTSFRKREKFFAVVSFSLDFVNFLYLLSECCSLSFILFVTSSSLDSFFDSILTDQFASSF